jgi:hypothetical protein
MDPITKHTAVLVVHGMGLQRPLETVRGIVKAVWQATDKEAADHKIWMQFERSSADIDLPVITTNAMPEKPDRTVDFHELYWAHLMSETRAVAVLLWLFELVRKGPWLKPNMKLVWSAGALFLVLMIFSTALLVLKVMERIGDFTTRIHEILGAPILMFFIFFVVSTCVFAWYRAWKFALYSVLAAACMVGLAGMFAILHRATGQTSAALVNETLPTFVAFAATWLLMGRWSIPVFVVTYVLSAIFECVLLQVHSSPPFIDWNWLNLSWPDLIPWRMDSSWCFAAASVILATYLMISAAFLQPYLGDAARYFRDDPSNVAVRREIRRQAVNMLQSLHKSGRYDRIVVVAHSLGTVIAYDMLRAYFAYVARSLPTTGHELERKITEAEREIDEFNSKWDDFEKQMKDFTRGKVKVKPDRPYPTELRTLGREIVGIIAQIVANEPASAKERTADHVPVARADSSGANSRHRAWLVTDFVTLGSPLTHAHYLMCEGKTPADLDDYFGQRVAEGVFPICPPKSKGIDKDKPLTYVSISEPQGPRWFHNRGLFGLTRWTNLYYPVSELFRGDPIGGSLEDVFGGGIVDVALDTDSECKSVSAHITYWAVPDKNPEAQHIRALRDAIDLPDKGTPNAQSNFAPSRKQ